MPRASHFVARPHVLVVAKAWCQWCRASTMSGDSNPDNPIRKPRAAFRLWGRMNSEKIGAITIGQAPEPM